jgi:serine/threonine protein kinase
VAPEILKNIPYDQSADMWSVGVILFVLLCGYPPFAHDDQSILFQLIRTGEWQFHESDWSQVSQEAQDLISNLLVVDPVRRLTAQQALQCDWLRQDDVNLSMKDLSASLAIMKERKQKFKNVARSVMWMNKGVSQPRDMNANGGDKVVNPEDMLNDDEQEPKIIL